jgi:hypothetical protein
MASADQSIKMYILSHNLELLNTLRVSRKFIGVIRLFVQTEDACVRVKC